MSSSEEEKQEYVCTAPESLKVADNVRVDLLPEKSRELYWATYNAFTEWKDAKKVNIITENVILDYFRELADKYKPSTLWSRYSMLRSTVKIEHNIRFEDFRELSAFLKQNSSGYEGKKSKVLTPDDAKKFLSNAPDKIYLSTKVALIFRLFGGCRNGELCSLTPNDVTDHGDIMKITLKRSSSKTKRDFIIEGEPLGLVKAYRSLRPKNATVDKFFLTYRNGKCVNQPLGKNKFGAMPKEIAKFLKLPNPEMYTGHAIRRSSTTTTLYTDRDCTISDFKRLGGWQSSALAEGYIEDSMNHETERSEQITDAIEEKSCEDVSFEEEPHKIKVEVFSPEDTQNTSDSLSNRDGPQLRYRVGQIQAGVTSGGHTSDDPGPSTTPVLDATTEHTAVLQDIKMELRHLNNGIENLTAIIERGLRSIANSYLSSGRINHESTDMDFKEF